MAQITSKIHVPARYGGMGLNSRTRDSPAAYWASWCDASTTILQRMPDFVNQFKPSMIQLACDAFSGPVNNCLRELHNCSLLLLGGGFVDLPTWEDIVGGMPPPTTDPLNDEPGEARKGWQKQATRYREAHLYNNFLGSLDSAGPKEPKPEVQNLDL